MSSIYSILLSAHSGFRWLVLLALVFTTFLYLFKWMSSARFSKKSRKPFAVTVMLMHIQVLVGLVLYFLSPKVIFSADTFKVDIIRFFTVEHSLLMILSVIVITIGSVKLKKENKEGSKFKTGFWFALVALLLILIGIPWPFQSYGAGWF